MRRPSYYVLLCVALVLTTFSASGHLRIGPPNARRAAATPATMRLEPPRRQGAVQRVQGSVLDTMGYLLAGVDVEAGADRTRTDADGRFRLEVPRAFTAELVLAANGHRRANVRVWPLAGEPLFTALEPSAPWDAQLPAGAEPRGGVIGEGLVRNERGTPLAGALVLVAETLAMARTDDTGRYEIELPNGNATLLVHQPEGGADDRGFAVRSQPITIARDRGRVPLPELTAAVAAVLRGTVRDGVGQPQKGVPLQLAGDGFVRTVASGDGGAFRIAGLLPGDYELRSFAFRGALGSVRKVSVHATVADCELHLQALAERRLQVVTEQGKPVARALVATSVDGLRREVVRADDGGYLQTRAAAAAASFDVRTGADYRPMRVVAPPEADGRLVVAMP